MSFHLAYNKVGAFMFNSDQTSSNISSRKGVRHISRWGFISQVDKVVISVIPVLLQEVW
jgi:hypothetical protein